LGEFIELPVHFAEAFFLSVSGGLIFPRLGGQGRGKHALTRTPHFRCPFDDGKCPITRMDEFRLTLRTSRANREAPKKRTPTSPGFGREFIEGTLTSIGIEGNCSLGDRPARSETEVPDRPTGARYCFARRTPKSFSPTHRRKSSLQFTMNRRPAVLCSECASGQNPESQRSKTSLKMAVGTPGAIVSTCL